MKWKKIISYSLLTKEIDESGLVDEMESISSFLNQDISK